MEMKTWEGIIPVYLAGESIVLKIGLSWSVYKEMCSQEELIDIGLFLDKRKRKFLAWGMRAQSFLAAGIQIKRQSLLEI